MPLVDGVLRWSLDGNIIWLEGSGYEGGKKVLISDSEGNVILKGASVSFALSYSRVVQLLLLL